MVGTDWNVIWSFLVSYLQILQWKNTLFRHLLGKPDITVSCSKPGSGKPSWAWTRNMSILKMCTLWNLKWHMQYISEWVMFCSLGIYQWFQIEKLYIPRVWKCWLKMLLLTFRLTWLLCRGVTVYMLSDQWFALCNKLNCYDARDNIWS